MLPPTSTPTPTPLAAPPTPNAALLTDEARLRYLQAQRNGIATAERQMNTRLQHNDGAAVLLSAAYHELALGDAMLQYANDLERKDSRQRSSVQAQSASNPTRQLAHLAQLARQRPTPLSLARAQLEAQLGDAQWTSADTAKLRQIVLIECKSVLAHQLLRTHGPEEALELVERMSESELARAIGPSHPLQDDGRPWKDRRGYGDVSRPGDALDWQLISNVVSRHSPADCRTHWTMHVRPPLLSDSALPQTSSKTWSSQELEALIGAVEAAKTPAKGGKRKQDEARDGPIPWEHIASQLGNGRTGYDCLAAYRRRTAGTADASAWTEQDTDDMFDLVGIFGQQWSQVASRLAHPHLPANVSLRFHKPPKKKKKAAR